MVIVRLASQFIFEFLLRSIRLFLQLRVLGDDWWFFGNLVASETWGPSVRDCLPNMQRGDVPPAILQSDIFHTLTSQYGYRTMSYFDSRQFYRNIIQHHFLQWSWGQKTHQYRNICLQLGWHFVLPKVAERIPCSKKYGWLPKLEEAPPPYLEIASKGALSSKGLIH